MSARSSSRRSSAAVEKPAADTPPEERRLVWIGALVIVLAGFGAYWGVRDAPLVFDDIPAIAENESIRDLTQLGRVLNPPADGSGVDSRPIVNLSLALNHAAGGLQPRGYHLTNIAIHVLAGLALFGFLRRTVRLTGVPEFLRGATVPVAGGAALLWTVHPLQTETVICIVQRTEALVSLCYLTMLYAFVRAAAPDGRRGWFGVALAACVAGMATKEVMVTAPVLVLLYDRAFLAGTFAEAWRRRGRWHLAFAGTWLLLAALVLQSGGGRGGAAGFGHGYSSWDYLLTQARAIVTYLKLSVWPHPLILDYGIWWAKGFGDVAWEFLVLAGLAGLSVYTSWRWPRAGLAGVAFFLILGPSSSVYPLISQTIAEHRMHLPLAAVLTLIVVALFRFVGRRAAVATCLLASGAGLWLTIQRGRDFASEETLWTDLTRQAPENPWGYAHLAKMHFLREEFAQAERFGREALRRAPEKPDMHLAWGLALEKLGRLPEAAAAYQESLRLRSRQPLAWFRLGVVSLRLGNTDAARASFESAMHLQPDDFDTRGNLAVALLQLGRLAEAAPHFARLVELRPDSIDARYNLAQTLAQLGRPADALPHLQAAVTLAPGAADLRTALGGLLAQLGRNAEARGQLQEAVRLDPQARDARTLLEQLR